MYIKTYKRKLKEKTYKSVYLVESYRENGKVNHRHLANLSRLPKYLLDGLQALIKGGKIMSTDKLVFTQGKSCGGLIVIKEICKRLGILHALGKNSQASLALLQIIARVLCQGSRLYIATQWKAQQAIDEILGIDAFNEDSLYANLEWLSENQEKIEEKVFNFRHRETMLKTIYLYDVTSSYLEGTQNELAAYGYNRDGKRGKMQIVIGLLCDEDGYPVSVQVFEGNTQDVATVADQLKKLKERFGVKHVVFVGDRGMIKSASIEEITEKNWHYITAITKPQIQKLIQQKVFQLELFTDKLIEVKQDDIRYVLHRNPMRAEEISQTRQSKIETVKKLMGQKNEYLASHSKASETAALKAIQKKASLLKVMGYLNIQSKERDISIGILHDQIDEDARLDGCYVIKSNLPEDLATAKTLHDRYKDLALVEQAFRTMKQAFEEIRPFYVRKEKRTRGHVLVCMLAYMVIKYVWGQCQEIGLNQTSIFEWLDRIQYIQYKVKDVPIKTIPNKLSAEQEKILKHLKIKLPAYV